MNIFIQVFYSLIYEPLLGFLVFIYNILPYKDLGLAVIILTIIVRLILLPSSIHSLKSQKAISALQPEIEKIQNKYKQDKERQAKEVFGLYQKHKVNPLGSILSLVIQIPVLLGIYRVFLNGFQNFNYFFLGVIDLSKPNIYLALIVAISQFFQSKTMFSAKDIAGVGKDKEFQKIFQKQMIYFLPLFTFFILLKIPSVIALYFLVSNIFTIFQQYFILKDENKYESKTN
jgi:YidC/Oxa1 family membrane protein insertase